MSKEASPNTICRAPTEKPPFTLSHLKKAIPPNCFQRSLLRSFYYLLSDLIMISSLFYLAIHQISNLPSPLNYLAWPLYWQFQGLLFGGIFNIAHECSHHAFSDYQLLDDTIGFILHTSLLVPYFSLKYSHRNHHTHNGSLQHDEAFVPKFKSSLRGYAKHNRAIYLFVIIALGWPMYLAFNFHGHPYPRFASHFDPYSPIYTPRERAYVLLSDVGILAALYVLYRFTVAFSLSLVIKIYGMPCFVMGSGLVMIVYLQHTHPELHRYDSTEWDWLRGSLVTVDRDYGFVNRLSHNVTNAHVVHHLFPMLPHYNAVEATEAIQPVLGKYYRFDSTPVFKALWREVKECVYVESDGEEGKGVYSFKKEL